MQSHDTCSSVSAFFRCILFYITNVILPLLYLCRQIGLHRAFFSRASVL